MASSLNSAGGRPQDRPIFRSVCRQVVEFGADAIGISAHTLGIINGNKLAGRLKEKMPDIPIFIGGPHVTSAPVETLTEFPHYDIAVVGKAEKTLLELLPFIERRQLTEGHLKDVDGLAFRGSNGCYDAKIVLMISLFTTFPGCFEIDIQIQVLVVKLHGVLFRRIGLSF